MTINPDPFVMTVFAKQCQGEFQAESDRYRLARLAQSSNGAQQRPRWTGPRSAVAVVVALALLAAGTVAAKAPASQPLAALAEAADSVAAYLLAADGAETTAVQKVREAAVDKASPKLILGKFTFTDLIVS